MDDRLVDSCPTYGGVGASFGFDPESGWERRRLGCACGGESFRLIGWPRAALAPGGAFRRTFSRVLSEVRAAVRPPDAQDSFYGFPVFALCEACGREARLFDGDPVPDRLDAARRGLPRESFRCRVCRRSAFAVALALAEDPSDRQRAAAEIRVRCTACLRSQRVAWADGRASEQQRRLDRLYGRTRA